MSKQSLQPEYMKNFQCIGAECEDTCCAFWNVSIDKNTYRKYEEVQHPDMSQRLMADVELNEASNRRDEQYATMRLNAVTGSCSFHDGGLCAIQVTLGEAYLSQTCATYPRKINEFEGAQEISATLSCPEAARLALLNPEGMEFFYDERKEASNMQWNARLSKRRQGAAATLDYFWELRVVSIEIMQNRNFSVSHRLMMLAVLADQVDEAIRKDPGCDLTQIISRYREELAGNGEITSPSAFPGNRMFQLKFLNDILLTIIEKKLWVNRRYKECLDAYLEGMKRSDGQDLEGVMNFYGHHDQRLAEAYMNEKEYILENYLVNHLFSSMFPAAENEKLFQQVFYFGVLYALIRIQLVGMFANGESLSDNDAVKLIQSFTKNFEHSSTFKKEVLKKCKDEQVLSLGHLSLLVMH